MLNDLANKRTSHSLVKNHCFIDGNKRIGAYCLFILLELNSIEINVSNQEIIETFLKIASNNLKYDDFLKWLNIKCSLFSKNR